jgi:plastocyanin
MTTDDLIREMRHGALAMALFVALVSPGVTDSQGTGTITGTITTRAAAPAPVRVTIDQRVCGDELPDESIVADASGRLANAVVSLAGAKAGGNPAIGTVMNEKCRFTPRVQIVRPNATVATSSRDPILHTTNAQTESGRGLFNVAIPMPGITISRPVPRAGVVRVSCNTHPWMRGWILVTDELAAVTGADGTFTLTNVPAGTYELRVWHESLKGAPQKVTVAAGATASVQLVVH